MNKIIKFEEYLQKGIVRKRESDKIRADDLIKESERDKKFLDEIIEKISLNDENANNFIENVYNIILKMVRAKMLLEGYKASGYSAHEVEVSYMINLGFSETDTEYMDEIRHSRNGMLYYGASFNKDYAQKCLSFLDKIYPKLKDMVSK